MKLSQLLAPELILLPFASEDKWRAISALARAAVDAGALAPRLRQSVEEALVARERSMTTGMEHGVAIPHAAVDGIEEAVAALGISPEGIDFDTLDGAPARIVVCLIIPRAQKLLHIKTLAEIARLLGRAEVRARLLQCPTGDAALAVIREEER